MSFLMEIKKTSQRKTASLDNVYQIVLECEDPRLLDFGKLPADSLVKVTIEPESKINVSESQFVELEDKGSVYG